MTQVAGFPNFIFLHVFIGFLGFWLNLGAVLIWTLLHRTFNILHCTFSGLVVFAGRIGIGGTIVRSRYAIAVVAVILIGFGVKQFFFSAPTAEAGISVIQVCSEGYCKR